MSDKDTGRLIGMIAGRGVYPVVFARAARKRGVKLVVAGFKGETSEDLLPMVENHEWLRVGQLGKLIKYFKKAGVQEVVMMGQVAPKHLYDFIPDTRALKIMTRLKEKNAESLFGAVADELTSEGMTILSAVTFLDDAMPAAGHVCGPVMREAELEDLKYGFGIAKETSRLDIGQTVVVREGTVLAVEAFEGTNACIRRGGELGKKKGVKVIKGSKPNQDFRFDVPVIGPDTIRHCAEAGIKAMGVEAGCTLILDEEAVAEKCRKEKVSLYALGSGK